MKKTRYSGIDALRAIGCVMIAMMHIRANTGYEIQGFLYNNVLGSAADFVRLFLMISAFGMCCGYFENTSGGRFDPEAFYSRRFGKLWTFFALLVVLDVAMQRTPEALAEGFMNVTMVFGLLPNNSLNVIGVGWTLGLIFLFYFMFPFFVYLWNRKSRAWFAFGVSLVINWLCSGYFFTEKFGISGMADWKNMLGSAPMFLAGGLLYLYRDSIICRVKRYRWLWLAVCLGVTAGYFVIPGKVAGINMETIRALVVFVPWLMYAISVDSPVLSNPVTRFLSSIGMEIYLAHMVAFRVVEKLGLCYLFGKGIWSYLTTVAVTMAVLITAIVVYRKVSGEVVRKWQKLRKSKN